MIVKLFNRPHIVYQSPDSDDDVPNEALGVGVDNGGTLCLWQGGNCIVLNKGTVPELIKMLKQLSSE